MTPFRSGYREGAGREASEAVHEAVGQMVEQFADPFACLRELVQNALDAGTTRIDVAFHWTPDGKGRGVIDLSVRDDGHGMSLEVVERCLLVLFRSSKDGDPKKIGKFGIGFFSVFALRPTVVTVETGTSDAQESVKLTLQPDFQYEVVAAPPRKGTLVTLDVEVAAAEVRAFVERGVASLTRWCEHVDVPLTVRTDKLPGGEIEARIDRPFATDQVVKVEARDPDGTVHLLAVDAGGGMAFYNRGILLHTQSTPLLSGVFWKVNAPGIHHTVSRDGVRHDAQYDRVVEQARVLIRTQLRARAVAAFAEMAGRCVAARRTQGEDREASRTLTLLCKMAHEVAYSMEPPDFAWPLAHPVAKLGGDGKTARFKTGWLGSEVPLSTTTGADLLTQRLAEEGVPVVDLSVGTDETRTALFRLYDQTYADKAVDVHARRSVVEAVPVERWSPEETALLTACERLLKAVDVKGVSYGVLLGAVQKALHVPLPERLAVGDRLLPEKAKAGLKGQWVVLSLQHELVQNACKISLKDPSLAALVVTRSVLLEAGLLDEDRDATLQRHAALGGA